MEFKRLAGTHNTNENNQERYILARVKEIPYNIKLTTQQTGNKKEGAQKATKTTCWAPKNGRQKIHLCTHNDFGQQKMDSREPYFIVWHFRVRLYWGISDKSNVEWQTQNVSLLSKRTPFSAGVRTIFIFIRLRFGVLSNNDTMHISIFGWKLAWSLAFMQQQQNHSSNLYAHCALVLLYLVLNIWHLRKLANSIEEQTICLTSPQVASSVCTLQINRLSLTFLKVAFDSDCSHLFLIRHLN